MAWTLSRQDGHVATMAQPLPPSGHCGDNRGRCPPRAASWPCSRDVQPFAARCLAKADEAEFVEPLSHFLGRFDDGGERDVAARVQIEDKTPRNFRMLRLAVPGMQFERGHLRDSGETFHSINLKIGFAIAGDGYELQQIGGAWHGMPLKELLASDAVACPDDRTGGALNVFEHPRSHGLEVTSEIELRHRLAIASI